MDEMAILASILNLYETWYRQTPHFKASVLSFLRYSSDQGRP